MVLTKIFCSQEHFLFPQTFFELDSTPTRRTRRTTKLLLGPLSVVGGQKDFPSLLAVRFAVVELSNKSLSKMSVIFIVKISIN